MLKKIFKITIFLFATFIATLVFFTSFYLNVFKDDTTKYLISKLNLDSLDYEYIQGNLISGFSVNKISVYSDKYSLKADLVQSSINIIDIVNNLENINFIEVENAELFLKNQYDGNINVESDENIYVSNENLYVNVALFKGFPVRKISLNNFNILNNDYKIYLEELKLKSNLEYSSCDIEGYKINGDIFDYPFSLNSINGELSTLNKNIQLKDFKINNDEDYLFLKNFDVKFQLTDFIPSIDVQGTGNTYLYGYNFIIDSLKVFKPENRDNYKYAISIGSYKDEYFSFNKIYSSDFLINEEIWDFKIEEFTFLNENFNNIKGEVSHLDDSVYISVPYNEKDRLRNKLNKSVLGCDLKFYENIVDINSLVIKIGNFKPLELKSPAICSVVDESLTGDSIVVRYKNGELLINSFIYKNSQSYDVSLLFSNFDLDLFRGLNVGGILSGNLHIKDYENDNQPFHASFSGAKVKNLSNNSLTVDKVGIDGSISNNELEITNIDMEKKIGPLNVSGSFSSLDNFYDKIVDNLKIKIK
tara:strand:- start:589 stop:2181 length:1593 start_codon:yes stop_codon:yes gene_type:complete